MKFLRITKGWATNALGALLVLAILTAVVFLMLQVSSTQRVIGELSVNNDQLREQLLDEDIKPVAPPAEKVTGDLGTPGPTGATGLPGRPGKDGKNGEPGEPGPIGPPGPGGAKGSDGLNGDNGKSGPPGPPGATGAQGPEGTPGIPGSNGVDGRGLASLVCQPDGSWLVTYTDATTSTTDGPCRIVPIPPNPEQE